MPKDVRNSGLQSGAACARQPVDSGLTTSSHLRLLAEGLLLVLKQPARSSGWRWRIFCRAWALGLPSLITWLTSCLSILSSA
eukprot:CAMPEP_0195024016 /NCGR_PEP_ID=MMETSP0326_2-20130528/44254_1 /TAXON_ID=2866 ORGANISM="Crypthecodinium cohnii, Strain Seligo" /NCGR_SAMPLE_ID=MMETSP0326_2 /ASSEMBLY_ACC=CAM_ASM_000348 /LENGTH=81 /DNA_ID=CAMNT_0040044613 /DNA_START=202 /DNA_END=444 /DNA_ORIENTATION=-